MVGQDWGGLLGLRLVAEYPERFAAVVAANTFLPTGDEPPREAFERWRAASQRMMPFSAGSILTRTCTPPIAPDVAAAYDAPFPDERYLAGAREFPLLVPTRPDDPASSANRAAWSVLERFEKPVFCAFSDGDPITRGSDRAIASRIPGARSVEHTTIAGASHFLQEDRPDEFAGAILRFLQQSSLASTV
jgi:haloalkane dehalogenase